MSGMLLLLAAGGFIGRHLAEHFARDGWPVLAATRRPVEYDHANIRNVVAPYDDVVDFARWTPECTEVVHAASASTPGSSAAQPQLDGNLRTTLAMIEALQDSLRTRLPFLSPGGMLYVDRDMPAREDDPLRPRSYHGAGKAAAKHFLHAWATQYGGTAALGAPIDAGAHAFNAASGTAISFDALLDHIDAITDRPLDRLHEPRHRVDVHSITADTTAARATFHWMPTTPLDEGLRRTWQ